MQPTHQKLTHKAALLVIGAALGALGFSTYIASTTYSPFSRGFWKGMRSSLSKHQPVASACTPHANEDDIFFLTCGGIY